MAPRGVYRFASVEEAEAWLQLMMRRARAADVIADAETHDVLGVPIPIASPATLILTKNTYRPQDAIDRAFLEGLVR